MLWGTACLLPKPSANTGIPAFGTIPLLAIAVDTSRRRSTRGHREMVLSARSGRRSQRSLRQKNMSSAHSSASDAQRAPMGSTVPALPLCPQTHHRAMWGWAVAVQVVVEKDGVAVHVGGHPPSTPQTLVFGYALSSAVASQAHTLAGTRWWSAGTERAPVRITVRPFL